MPLPGAQSPFPHFAAGSALYPATGKQYYHHDALGSTVNLTDAGGAEQVSYILDPWGHITGQTGTSVNRQIFTGQEHDEKTGLIYFGARYYDPDTARFMTQDPYLGEPGTPPSLHRYLYAYSNPTVYIDLLGYAVVTGGIESESRDIVDGIKYESPEIHINKNNDKWDRMISAVQKGQGLGKEEAIDYIRNKYNEFGINDENSSLKATVTLEDGDGASEARKAALEFLGKDFEEKYINHPSAIGKRFNKLFDRWFFQRKYTSGDIIDISEFWELASRDFVSNVLEGRNIPDSQWLQDIQFPGVAAEYEGGAPPSLNAYYRNQHLWNSVEVLTFPLLFTDIPVVGMMKSSYKLVPAAAGNASKKTDFIVSENGTAVHVSQNKARKSIEGAGATKIGDARKGDGEIYRMSTTDGPIDVRFMDGKVNGGRHEGPRTITTEAGKDKVYVHPNGQRIRGSVSKSDRKGIGHVHGQVNDR